MKTIYLILCLSASVFLTAQTSTHKELKLIENNTQAMAFLEASHSKKNKLITFNEEKHNTTLAKSLFKLSKGRTKTNESEFNKTYYKVVEKVKTKHYRVSAIVFNGNEMSANKIKAFREDITFKYNSGLPFSNLVKKYSTGNGVDKGGDMGWFCKGEMAEEFEIEATKEAYSVGDIFNVDVPSENKYYVLLKTHEPKDINEIKVLKIVERK